MQPERRNCIDCGSPLGRGAFKCRCGWKASEPAIERPRVSCCFSLCNEGALAKVRTKTGWANVCLTHYPQLERWAPEIPKDSPRGNANKKIWAKRILDRHRDGQEVGRYALDCAMQVAGDVAPGRVDVEADFEKVKQGMAESGFGYDDAVQISDAFEQEIIDRAQP